MPQVDVHYLLYQRASTGIQDTITIYTCDNVALNSYTIPSNGKALSMMVVKDVNNSSIYQLVIDADADIPDTPWETIEVDRQSPIKSLAFARDYDRQDMNLLFLGTEDLRPLCKYKIPVYHIVSLFLAEVRIFFESGTLYVARNPQAANADASYARLLLSDLGYTVEVESLTDDQQSDTGQPKNTSKPVGALLIP